MKSKTTGRIKAPKKKSKDVEIIRFLNSNDPEELERQGFMVRDSDRSDIDGMLRKYLSEPNNSQLNIRLPANAKRLLSRMADQKTIDASTLARIWIVERLRKESL